MKNLFIALAALVAVGCSKGQEMNLPITITNQTSHVWYDPCFWVYDNNFEVIRFTQIKGIVGMGKSIIVPSYGATYFSVFFKDGEYNAFSYKQEIIGRAVYVYDDLLY